jgi:hypothetical protein
VARAQRWLRRLRVGAVKLARASTRVARTRLSGMLWSDERQLLLGTLLAWAKLDEGSLVAEPQDNQLRWRTQHEWDALRADRARLGDNDVLEQRAFQSLSFLFSSYACRSYWWESVDLLQKLFLTSVLTFIAPRSSVQIIAACLFAFAMLLATLQVKPYRSASGNQLAALSQINIFLCVCIPLSCLLVCLPACLRCGCVRRPPGSAPHAHHAQRRRPAADMTRSLLCFVVSTTGLPACPQLPLLRPAAQHRPGGHRRRAHPLLRPHRRAHNLNRRLLHDHLPAGALPAAAARAVWLRRRRRRG